MPTVPLNTRRGPQVRNRPLDPGFQRIGGVSALAFGGGLPENVGRGIGRLGDQLAQVVLREQQDDNERRAKELDVEFGNRKRRLLDEFFSQQGANAVDDHAGVQQRLDQLQQEIAGQSQNDRVREMFEVSSQQRLATDKDRIGRYVVGQRRVAALGVSSARVAGAVEDAVRGRNDDEVIRQSTAVIRGEIETQARINGWSTEEKQQAFQAALTGMYKTMFLSALSQNDVAGAKAILDDNSEKMAPAIVAELRDRIKTPEIISQAQTYVDGIIRSGMTEREMKEQARKDFTGPIRDEVIKRIDRRFTESKELDRERRNDTVEEWTRLINNREASLDHLRVTRPDQWALISGDKDALAGLEATERQSATRQVHPNVSESGLFDNLSSMSQAELAKINAINFQSRLSKSDYDSLVKRVAGAKKALSDDITSSAPYKRGEQILKSVAPNSFGFSEREPSKAQLSRQRATVNSLTEWIEDFIESEGRVPTNPELRQRALELTTPVEADEPFFDIFNEESFDSVAEALQELGPDQIATLRVDVDDVPKEWVSQVEDIFRSHNIQPTEDLIEQYLGAHVADDEARKLSLLGRSPQPNPITNLVTEAPTETGTGLTPATAVPEREPVETFPQEEPTVREGVSETFDLPAEGPSPPLAEDVDPREVVSEVDGSFVATNKLMSALLLQESDGDPNAFNEQSGAQGAFQIIPATATQPGFGVDPITEEDTFDPASALRFARDYLSAMLNRYNGNLDHALAAYNWGPGNVDLWIKAGASFAQLPRETRNYITRIKNFTVSLGEGQADPLRLINNEE